MTFMSSVCLFLLAVTAHNASMLVSAGGVQTCEAEVVKTCIYQYMQILEEEEEQSHCSRVQKLASCFADKSKDCRGKGVNLFRLWILREAQLEAKLGICPKVNFKNLEESVENTDEARENKLTDIIDENELPSDIPCAVQVHARCSKQFLDVLKNQRKSICKDALQWFNCYEGENCKSKILAKYAKFVKKVGKKLYRFANDIGSCKEEL